MIELKDYERHAATTDFECAQRLRTVSNSVLDVLIDDFDEEFGSRIRTDLEELRVD